MTPKERAAMQQALEALEAEFYDDVKQPKLGKAITSLREVLEQPKQKDRALMTALDKLGLAIANAGYTWTPEMREAYEEGVRND